MSRLSRAVATSGGGRRIYRTVRRHRGAVAAVRVLLASGWTLVWVTLRAAGRPRIQNAVRHFAWSAWLTAAYDAGLARAVGEAHERGSGRPRDSAVDRRNNEVGREYAARHPVAGPAPYALWRLAGAGIAAWRSGRLWVDDNGEVVTSPSSPGRTRPPS